MKLEYEVKDSKYETLKDLLKNYFQVSERLIIKLKREHRLVVNENEVYINYELKLNDKISIDIDFEESGDNIVPVKMDLEILYEDDAILVVDKPQDCSVHPSQGHFENTLANGVKYYFNEKNLNRKIRIVNRLDKDTMGIVIFAKNDYIHECFIKQMKTNDYTKKYLGLVSGILENKEGTINVPIARKDGSIIERMVAADGDEAITKYKVLEEYDAKISLLEYTLLTGRTHQIRVHSKFIGHPLIGDTLYGNEIDGIQQLKGQQLIAYKINFIHPITKVKMEIISKKCFQINEILV